jgi:uncharacterized protein
MERLPEGWSRETRIRRDEEGRWFEGDDPLEHPGICSAFDRWIDRAPDGRYILKNAINWAYVAIEGAPIFVRAVRLDDAGVELALSDGTTERLAPETLAIGPEDALYCRVREGRFAARFDRTAQLSLFDAIGEDSAGIFLELGGDRWRPPRVADPLRSDPIVSLEG